MRKSKWWPILAAAILVASTSFAVAPKPVVAADTAVVADGPAAKPIDVTEPPFAEHDFAWMNGSNPQPSSLLGMGPVTWSLYAPTAQPSSCAAARTEATRWPAKQLSLAIEAQALAFEILG